MQTKGDRKEDSMFGPGLTALAVAVVVGVVAGLTSPIWLPRLAGLIKAWRRAIKDAAEKSSQ